MFLDSLLVSEVKNLPREVHSGIQVHRWIDDYTDHHPVVKQLNKLLTPYFSRYASVASDIYYDYFLSKKWDYFSSEDQASFIEDSYDLLIRNIDWLPSRVHERLRGMIADRWLHQLGTPEGLDFTFQSLHRRATFDNNFHLGMEVLDKEYFALEASFMEFFPELNGYVKLRLEELLVG